GHSMHLTSQPWAAAIRRKPFGRFFSVLVTALAAASFHAEAQAPLDVRIALVIGNSAYAAAPLVNPANDARAMGETLRGLGFDVVELRDAQKAQMAEAIAKVRTALQGKQGIGMLYYAGHGLQLDWQNYMVPVDAKMSKAADVPEQAVNINSVIDAFKGAGNRMNILVLDACRDNPFAGTASGKGLAQLDAPPGTFLAYATAPDNVAEDGDAKGGNGLYTQYLLEELKKPVAKIEDVFKRVRFNVRQKSQGRQIPWESTSLEDDFFFNTGKVVAVAKLSENDKENAFNAEKMDWDRIKDGRNTDDFFAFLKKYPSGFISEQAQAVLERLQKAKVTTVAGKDGLEQLPSSARFRLGDEWTTRVIDGYSNTEVRRGSTRVVKITEDRVELSDGVTVLTPEGGTISNRFIPDMSPPRLDLPAGEYVVGKKWEFRSIETRPNGAKGWVTGESRVTALEVVTVPAGSFKAYKVELRSINQFGARAELTRWMDPNFGVPLKMVRAIYPRSGPPDRDVFELVSLKRGPG
ncbi:MAG: caspase domain-containing protein, partial [Rhodoferax sp.]